MTEPRSLGTNAEAEGALYEVARRQVFALFDRVVAARVAQEVRWAREAWRLEAQQRSGGPSGQEVMLAALEAIERVGNEGQTAVGAHKAVRLVCATIGVPGAELTRTYRRSRAVVDDAPFAGGREREGGGRAFRSGDR